MSKAVHPDDREHDAWALDYARYYYDAPPHVTDAELRKTWAYQWEMLYLACRRLWSDIKSAFGVRTP